MCAYIFLLYECIPLLYSRGTDGILLSQNVSDVKAPALNQGFSRACSVADDYLIVQKKKTVHTQSHACAVCLSLQRSCCIFLGSYMPSFDTQRSHGVRDAPSHGNSPERVHEVQGRALTAESIKQRAGIQPNGLHWVTTTSQWFAPSIF